MKKLETNLFTTLEEARKFVTDNSDQGCTCPCCQQTVKIYKWTLTNQMAMFMLWLERNGGTGYYRDFIEQYPLYLSKVYSIPKHWGLIAKEDRNGFWKLTHKGTCYVSGLISVPQYALILDDTVIGYSPQEVMFDQSLRTKFDLKQTLKT